jgi:SanA protein
MHRIVICFIKKFNRIFIFMLLLFSINLYMVSYALKFIDNKALYKADAILIPGAGIRSDGSLTYMLRDRMDKGIELYFLKKADKILVSGDHGRKNYDEVKSMRDYAISKGVPKEDIFMDHAGFSTYDSVYRARDVFCCKSIIIVTQKYHLYRAVFNARILGIQAYGVSAINYPYYGMPYYKAREFAARIKDYIYCMALPKPKFLGKKIPITESGVLTE